jgi:hypothetical protein
MRESLRPPQVLRMLASTARFLRPSGPFGAREHAHALELTQTPGALPSPESGRSGPDHRRCMDVTWHIRSPYYVPNNWNGGATPYLPGKVSVCPVTILYDRCLF